MTVDLHAAPREALLERITTLEAEAGQLRVDKAEADRQLNRKEDELLTEQGHSRALQQSIEREVAGASALREEVDRLRAKLRDADVSARAAVETVGAARQDAANYRAEWAAEKQRADRLAGKLESVTTHVRAAINEIGG
jgi:chromosome segregation ATPase